MPSYEDEKPCSRYVYHSQDHGVYCRLGHDTKHFNVGQYRRVQKTASEIQDASFFDPNNEVVASHYT